MSTLSQLHTALQPILEILTNRSLDAQLQYDLSKRYPLSSSTIQQIKTLLQQCIQERSLVMRGSPDLRFGLLHKQSKEIPIRIDVVDMTGAGPSHTHTLGEVNLCFALDAKASFDGNLEGWVVYPAQSWHIPTVYNGRMLIMYFIPQGKIVFDTMPKR